jgi:hypothetical protein
MRRADVLSTKIVNGVGINREIRISESAAVEHTPGADTDSSYPAWNVEFTYGVFCSDVTQATNTVAPT